MSAALEVTEAGMLNQVQDLGRGGHRGIGVPVSGAADPLLLACANRLLGNADGDAAIEMPLVGPALQAAGGTVCVALAGAVQAQVQRADGQQLTLPPWHSLTLRPGDRLRVGAVRAGLAYLAVAGGVQVPLQLGSRSTYARAGLGGVEGRALQAGDRIACVPPAGPAAERRAEAFVHEDGAIRVMPGPQHERFTPEAWSTLLQATWRVARDSDRMGLRLEGPRLAHCAGADITSEGVVPGAMQVPANGLPIVLSTEAQTVGGYTKIAAVIRADLPRLAHVRAGSELRFAAVTRQQAMQALQHQRQALERWARGIAAWQAPGALDLDRLYTAPLVSGMIDACSHTLPWETP